MCSPRYVCFQKAEVFPTRIASHYEPDVDSKAMANGPQAEFQILQKHAIGYVIQQFLFASV